MRSAAVLVLFTFPLVVSAQTAVFKSLVQSLDLSKDTCISIEKVKPTTEAYDFVGLGGERLERLLLSELMVVSKKDELKESTALRNLTDAAATAWYGSQYSERDRWRKLEKYFQRTNHQLVSKFNILRTTSFRIPLMETPNRGFYYDRHGEEGELNLFQGKRPRSKEEKDEEKIPVRSFTEKELLDRLLKNLNRGGFYRGIRNGIFTFVGVSIQIDEKSLYKNKIPTARVVIMFGAKRLQRVKT